jgi:hypothetical protein
MRYFIAVFFALALSPLFCSADVVELGSYSWAELEAAVTANSAKETNTDDQTASEVAIEDTNENTDETTVEGAIDELYQTKQDSLPAMSEAEATAGTGTSPRSITPAVLKTGVEAHATNIRSVTAHGSVSSGTETFSDGWHTITVAGAQTWDWSWNSSGEITKIIIIATGIRSSAITGFSEVKWDEGISVDANNIPDSLSSGTGVDIITLISVDGGTTKRGFINGEFAN